AFGGAYEEDDGKFHLDLNLVALLRNVDKESITLPDGRVDILEIFVKRRALVRLDGTAEVKITPLEVVREGDVLQKEIAKLGLTHTLFMAKLNTLQRALYNEDPTDFMDLDKLKLLHRLGSLGEVQARKGDGYSTAVSQAILSIIGKDRKVGIGFVEKMDENISTSSMKIGSVLEILMPSSAEDTIAPTLVLESIDGLGNDDPFSIRFDQITAFRF
ncbi:MAG: hypothetical protein JWM52_165, partial [Candidatus Saccharibacteria bacterium]|nr:hypothetical protein [Candidatus Saccharibacteria bacterium]